MSRVLVTGRAGRQRERHAENGGGRRCAGRPERTLDWIDQAVAARHQGYLCVATTHTVMATRDDPSLRAAVLGAEFTVPDGQPLVWALKALGHDVRMQRAGLEWLLDRR